MERTTNTDPRQTSGHEYQRMSVNDNAAVQNGDRYNNNITNSGPLFMLGNSIAEAKSMLDRLQQTTPQINNDEATQSLDKKLDKITTLLEKLEFRYETAQVAGMALKSSSTTRKPAAPPVPYDSRTALQAQRRAHIPANYHKRSIALDISLQVSDPGRAVPKSYLNLNKVSASRADVFCNVNIDRVVVHGFGSDRSGPHCIKRDAVMVRTFPGVIEADDPHYGALLGFEIYLSDNESVLYEDNEAVQKTRNGNPFIWRTLVNETRYALIAMPFSKRLKITVYVKKVNPAARQEPKRYDL